VGIDQSIVDAAIDQWRRRLSPRVRVHGIYFEHKFDDFEPICHDN